MRFLCWFGFHKWSEVPSGRSRVCKRCGKIELKEDGRWSHAAGAKRDYNGRLK